MLIENAKTRISDLGKEGQPKPKRTSVFSSSNRTEITHLRIEQLMPYSKQARTVFDSDELESLAETVREHGIRQPLTVLRSQQEEGKYEIISGERRFRAAKLADLKIVPCIIIENQEKAEEISLVENIQRRDLHPVELAKALKSMVDQRGWGSQRELKKKLGLNESVVSELLKINTLPEEVRTYLMEKNIRGREVLRQLFKIDEVKGQLHLLNEMGDDKDHVHTKKVLPYKRSVLRFYMYEGDIHVQKTKLKTLTESEKNKLRIALHEALELIQN